MYIAFAIIIVESTCSGYRVKCNDGLQCIHKRSLCNGYVDCQDGSDESPEFCIGKF